MEQQKKIFGGEKISFFEKTMKKKIWKNFGKFFFSIFFFDLHIEKYRVLELIQGKNFFFWREKNKFFLKNNGKKIGKNFGKK